MSRRLGFPNWVVTAFAVFAGMASLSGCKTKHAAVDDLTTQPEGLAAEGSSAEAPSPSPSPVTAAHDQTPEGAPPRQARQPAVAVSPVLPGGEARPISAAALIGLLKSRKELRALTLETAATKFAGLVPAFEETLKDDERWTFEGVNDTGFVRAVTLTFLPTETDTWVFGSASVRLYAETPRRTFDELSRAATAVLNRPRWLDLNTRDRTAWSLGDGWELVIAVLEEGTVQVRSGRAARP